MSQLLVPDETGLAGLAWLEVWIEMGWLPRIDKVA